MRLNPKLLFGGLALTFAVIIATIFILNIPKEEKNTASLTSFENKFNLSFRISKKDKDEFSQITKSLNLPEIADKNIEFELDSTTSAVLNFATPIDANLEVSKKRLNITGQLHKELFGDFPQKNIKVPKTTTLAVYTPNATYFLRENLKLNQDFLNSIPKGQFILLFSDANYVFVYAGNDDDIDKLITALKSQNKDLELKEEFKEDIKLNLVKLVNEDEGIKQIIVFQKENFIYIASSQEAIEQLLRSENSNYTFPKNERVQTELDINNSEGNITEDILKLVLKKSSGESPSEVADAMSNIANASFSLNGLTFSGLINFK